MSPLRKLAFCGRLSASILAMATAGGMLLSYPETASAAPVADCPPNDMSGTGNTDIYLIQGGKTCSWTPTPATIDRTIGWQEFILVGNRWGGGAELNQLDVHGDATINITYSGNDAYPALYGFHVTSRDGNAASTSLMTSDGNLTLNMNTDASTLAVLKPGVASQGIWVDLNGQFEGNNVAINIAHNAPTTGWLYSYGVVVGGSVASGNYSIDYMARATFENLTIRMDSSTSSPAGAATSTMAGIRAIAQSTGLPGSDYRSGSGTVVVNGVTDISTKGTYSLGIYVSGRNSMVDINDSRIVTAGYNSSAIKLGKTRAGGNGGGTLISRGHMDIDTTQSDASSIMLLDFYSAGYPTTSLNADSDTSSAEIRSGREAVNFSVLDKDEYGSADGIKASFNNAVMTTTSATASLIKVESYQGSQLFAQTNAEFNLRGKGSSLTAASDGWLFEVMDNASLTANVRQGFMQGLTTTGETGAGSFTLNMSDNAMWRLAAKGTTTESTLTALNLSSGATVDASAGDFGITGNVSSLGGILDLGGTPDGSAGVPGQLLTIRGNYTAGSFAAGSNGTLILDTVLGNSASVTDKLVIDGGIASGDTLMLVRNAGGVGAQTTGDGILVVEAVNAATTAGATFSLGSNRVAAGLYEYSLHRGTDLTDNWYLSSEYRPPEPPPGPGPLPVLPDYRDEVPVYMVAPALANRLGLAMLGTYHDRAGEHYTLPLAPVYEERLVYGKDGRKQAVRVPVPQPADSSKFFAGGWARLFGETGSVGYGGKDAHSRLAKFEKHGPSYDYDLAGFQAGLDVYRKDMADGGFYTAGLYVGSGRIDSDVKGVYGGKAGSLAMDAYSVGAYATRKGASGWYLDGVLQGTLFRDIEGTSVGGERMDSDGWGFTASLEGGYPVALGGGFALEPQAQVIYQHISLDSGSDRFGYMHYDDTDAVYGRIGARLTRNWTLGSGNALTTWARANLWHTFGADAKTTFTNIDNITSGTMSTSLGGTWAQFGVGVSGQVTQNISLFASGDYNLAVGNGNGHSLSGRLGAKVIW